MSATDTRAILINPWTKEITEVRYQGTIAHMLWLMSNPLAKQKADDFLADSGWANGDILYVSPKARERAFSLNGSKVFGNGLILGEDETGEVCDAKTMLTDLQTQIKWGND